MEEEEGFCRVSAGLLALASSILRTKRDPTAADVQQAISQGLPRGGKISHKNALIACLSRLGLSEDERVVYRGTKLAVELAGGWQGIV